MIPMKPKILIATHALSSGSLPDEKDVLDQAQVVEEACNTLGYPTSRIAIGLNLEAAREEILRIQPSLIFNLVEGLNNQGIFVPAAAALFASMNIPSTGSSVVSLFNTSNKSLSKKILTREGLPTPDGFSPADAENLDPYGLFILKPVWEEGSVGLDEGSVFKGNNEAVLKKIAKLPPSQFLMESFFSGREFNVSILKVAEGPDVLAVAEIQFVNYPEEKPRILGYRSKWDPLSFEYTHTIRTFAMKNQDLPLLEEMAELALVCWDLFDLHGYARIDFRVDRNNKPYIIDINANPCLSPDSGFNAALTEARIPFTEAIQCIISDSTL